MVLVRVGGDREVYGNGFMVMVWGSGWLVYGNWEFYCNGVDLW